MRLVLLVFFLLLASESRSAAQSGNTGSQDSAASGHVRPRWGSYLIESFPSPAKASDEVKIKFYNHNDETLDCRVFDNNCREVLVIQEKQLVSAGLHTIPVKAFRLSTGSYFIRLTTYTAQGAENIVDIARFTIVK